MPNIGKEVRITTITSASLPAKKRILTVCVKLFLEQGYKKTTVAEIVHKAAVSNSIFQNIFRAKDGVLTELTEEDFYTLELGSAGLMRGYMVRPCDGTLTLEKKLWMFLTLSLRGYKVPEEEVQQILRFVEGLDIRTVAEQVMQKLFQALAMHYEFSLSEEAQAAAPAAPSVPTPPSEPATKAP